LRAEVKKTPTTKVSFVYSIFQIWSLNHLLAHFTRKLKKKFQTLIDHLINLCQTYFFILFKKYDREGFWKVLTAK
jgi:S-ribosylhomocysteine lyase LuxS involved in autoinducer biosynthesis